MANPPTRSSPPAQYALVRLPDSLQASPLTQALLNLVNATSERHYNKIYAHAETLFGLVAQPDFPDAKLASLIANLVTNFVGRLLVNAEYAF